MIRNVEKGMKIMRKIKSIILTVCLCLVIGMSLQVSAAQQTNITTTQFTKLLKPLDPFNRLDVNSASTAPLTRQKAAAIIIKLMGYEEIAKDYKNSTVFQDTIAYKGEIDLVAKLGMMSQTGKGLFSPQIEVTNEQAQVIVSRIQSKLEQSTAWKHAFYALSSSSQMDLIPSYDAVSFGWAQLGYDSVTQNFEVETTKDDFKVPVGFNKPLDLAKANGTETYLMIFFEDKGQIAKQLLSSETQMERVIKQIVALANGLTKDGITRSFDGVTIDFENFINSELAKPYSQFLKKLKVELQKNNKKLNVAVQPAMHFKGYDYKGIGECADKVILMAHDYAPKMLTPFEQEVGRVMTPITPIDEVYQSLAAIIDSQTGVQDKTKVVLQISYGSTQWQLKENKVIHTKPYTPTYDKIYERLNKIGTQGFYHEGYQNPYAVYEENGIKNIIWYENNKSVKAKIDLAKLFDIHNVSYWRLGLIPNYE